MSKIMSPSSGPVTYSPSSSVPEVETGSYHYYKMSIPQVDFVVMLVQYSFYQLGIIKKTEWINHEITNEDTVSAFLVLFFVCVCYYREIKLVFIRF